MADSERKSLPPYLPYKSLLSFLDHLRAIGMPSHIDKSVMTHMSGAMQSSLKSALRYMKLVNDEDVPDKRLLALVGAPPEARKAYLRDLFKSSYAFLDGKIDLMHTTPHKLKEAVSEQGATGETVEKIIAFMLAMAKDAEIGVSTILTKRAMGPRRARRAPSAATRQPQTNNDHDGDDEDDEAGQGEAMKVIDLPVSGGTLTLSGNINIFKLIGKERELVFKIIDVMNTFEQEQEGLNG